MSKNILTWLAMAAATLAANKAFIGDANANTPKEPKNPKVGVELNVSGKGKVTKATVTATAKEQNKNTELSKNHKDKLYGLAPINDTFYLPLSGNLVLDPAFATDRDSLNVLDNLFDALVHFDAKNNAVLDAAESYKVSDDGKRYVFKLRKNARWSDGTPVTAYNFVYAWQRLIDSSIKSPNRHILIDANILNAKEVASGKMDVDQLGVAALNDYELLVVLDKPTPWLLSLLASPATVPLKPVPLTASKKTIISNGAYAFAPDKNNDFLLVKNKFYWDAKNIKISYIRSYGDKDSSDYSVAFASSNRNILYVNKFNEPDLATYYANQIQTKIYPETKFLEVNLADRSMAKLPVRQALNLLINRASLGDDAQTFNVPTTVLAPPVVKEASTLKQNEEAMTFGNDNIQKALKLLASAGYSKKNPLVIKYIYQLDTTDPNSFLFQKAVTDQLIENSNQVIQIQYVGLKRSEYFSALKRGDFQLTTVTWKSDYNHASSFYNILLSTSGDNFSRYDSFKYDYLLSQAYKSTDDNERRQIYEQANQILQKDLPIIPLVWQADRIVTDPRLKNFAYHGYENLVKNMYFDSRVSVETPQVASELASTKSNTSVAAAKSATVTATQEVNLAGTLLFHLQTPAAVKAASGSTDQAGVGGENIKKN